MIAQKNNFKIDFIGIGFQRAGTTWISECLFEHPQVCFALIKEINFFTKSKLNINYYKKFFPKCSKGKIKGEYSPQYTHPLWGDPKKISQRIKNFFPNIKLIVCFRNPIERAYSQYFFEKENGREPAPTFEEAIKKNKYKYVEAGFYYKIIKKYFELFPRKKILVLIYEDIHKNPLKFIQSIYKFLGIESSFVPPSLNKVLALPPKRAFIDRYIFNIRDRLDSSFFGRKIKYILRPVKAKFDTFGHKDKIKISFTRKSNPRQPMKLKTKKHLQKLYKKDIKKLEKLINKDLSSWIKN